MSAAAPRYQLVQTPTRLELHDTEDRKTGAVYVDFGEGKAQHRLRFGGGKGQDIAKAIGLHKFKHPQVLDTTAGLGSEAFVLASLGCTVTLLERSPIMHALLADGLQRARHSDDQHLQAICQQMTLVHTDARDWLSKQLSGSDNDNGSHSGSDKAVADVIYLDPMFPERQKSALVQKEMRFIHALVGAEQDAAADAELLELARQSARHRVVVKRPRLAPLLSTLKPAFVISGKAVRYDVYLPIAKAL